MVLGTGNVKMRRKGVYVLRLCWYGFLHVYSLLLLLRYVVSSLMV